MDRVFWRNLAIALSFTTAVGQARGDLLIQTLRRAKRFKEKTVDNSNELMVLQERIELSTSPLPRECSTTELLQHLKPISRGARLPAIAARSRQGVMERRPPLSVEGWVSREASSADDHHHGDRRIKNVRQSVYRKQNMCYTFFIRRIHPLCSARSRRKEKGDRGAQDGASAGTNFLFELPVTH